jgi:hypothetical protein
MQSAPVDHEQTVARLRAELGGIAFDQACTDGARLSEEEALSLAAQCLD